MADGLCWVNDVVRRIIVFSRGPDRVDYFSRYLGRVERPTLEGNKSQTTDE